MCLFFFFSSRRRHTRLQGDWSSDVCSSDLRGRYTCRHRHERVGKWSWSSELLRPEDRKSVVYGKSVDLGGRRIIKKKKKKRKTAWVKVERKLQGYRADCRSTDSI